VTAVTSVSATYVNLTLSHVTGATSTTLTFSGGAETLAITAFGTGQNVWYPTKT
jgi:hypothetical protein